MDGMTTITPTRRPLLLRVKRLLHMAWLRYEISSAEEWLEDCRRDGIFDSLTLRQQRRHIATLYVELAYWERL